MIRMKNNLSYKTIWMHIAAWILVFLFMLADSYINYDPPNPIIFSLGKILPLILPVYLNLLIINKFLLKKMYLAYLLFLALILISFGFIAEWSAKTFVNYTNSIIVNGKEDLLSIRHIAAYSPLFAIILTSVLKFTYDNVQNRFKIKEAEKEKVNAQLELLKSQINPHFLFNTLNSLFVSSSLSGDNNTAEGIAKLSQLMRYMIYDSKVDLIGLNDEIEHIKNYIDLLKLRFSGKDDIDVKLVVKGETNMKMIPPMLLLPFVENAFKFSYSIKDKFFIHIEIETQESYLLLKVKNSINQMKKVNDINHSGFGIKNTKARLDLIFPEDHEIKFSDDKNIFNVFMKIPV